MHPAEMAITKETQLIGPFSQDQRGGHVESA